MTTEDSELRLFIGGILDGKKVRVMKDKLTYYLPLAPRSVVLRSFSRLDNCIDVQTEVYAYHAMKFYANEVVITVMVYQGLTNGDVVQKLLENYSETAEQ